jgi:3-methyladenine DNA glycosylase AlkD
LSPGAASLGRVTKSAKAQPDLALVQDARRRLREVGDPARAPAMQAYMKSDLPYYGVPAPAARVVFREVLAAHPLADRATWLATVHALWDDATHREERYAALALVRHRRYAEFRDPDALSLYRHLVTTGGWWDVVDDVATHLVGPLLLDHPADVRLTIWGWATDDDRWLRRTAVICQLGAKERTDLALLTHAMVANLDEGDFFLRKAIGWALRQHARTDPDWVRAFVAAHDDRLSGLSRREALKHIGAAA